MNISVIDPIQARWTTSSPRDVLFDSLTDRFEAYAPGDAVMTVRSGGAAADITISVTATLESVRALTERAYDEGGIRQHGIRQALLSKLAEAAAGKAGALEGYIALLRAQRSKHVVTEWADRLIANAVWIVGARKAANHRPGFVKYSNRFRAPETTSSRTSAASKPMSRGFPEIE